MATKIKFGLEDRNVDRYLDLVKAFPLTSIKSDDHLAAAQAVMDDLLAKGEMDGAEEAYLDALSDLVAAYEAACHAIGPASDAAMLQHLLEAKGVKPSAVSESTGIPKSSISEVLAGKKPFTRKMIGKLAKFFGVSPGMLAANFSS